MPRYIAILFILFMLCYSKGGGSGDALPSEEERAAELKKCEAELKELKVKYGKRFKKNTPMLDECEGCKVGARIGRLSDAIKVLKYAIHINLPYPTIEEKTVADEKIKIEYNKKIGTPITDFELSITGVHFNEDSIDIPNYSLVRTTKGAIVKYRPKDKKKLLEVQLNIDEWLDFINSLYKCINKWERDYHDIINVMYGGRDTWQIAIYSLDKNIFISSGHLYPPNWNDFMKVMTDLEAKIKSKTEAK